MVVCDWCNGEGVIVSSGRDAGKSWSELTREFGGVKDYKDDFEGYYNIIRKKRKGAKK